MSTFLQLDCSNFKLKYVKCLRVAKIFEGAQLEGVEASYGPGIVIRGVSDAGSNFHVEWRNGGKV